MGTCADLMESLAMCNAGACARYTGIRMLAIKVAIRLHGFTFCHCPVGKESVRGMGGWGVGLAYMQRECHCFNHIALSFTTSGMEKCKFTLHLQNRS